MNDSNKVPEPSTELVQRAISVRKASTSLGQSTDIQRKEALAAMADALAHRRKEIVAANQEDLRRSTENGLIDSLLSRLKLDEKKLNAAIEGVRKVAFLPDPTGSRQLHRELDRGLYLERLTVPLGVIGVIFEARPDALIQIASLAIRSGNASILKGGSEAKFTNEMIVKALDEGLAKSSLNPDSICLLTTREESLSLLRLEGMVDLIIPRGSNDLVRFIQDNTRIPVLGHADGVCHLYIDSAADLDKAVRIAIDSKCQYPAACNAIETLLLHENIASSFLNKAIPLFNESGVKLLGDELCCSLGIENMAEEFDWATEYLDLALSVKVVSTIDQALEHISHYGSRHTDSIVTNDQENANKFLNSVDSSGVFLNCSTRFADGFRYGFGAEVGISTQTLPPRGPVGLDGLVTYRYFLKGDGHVVSEYGPGGKSFSHNDLDL